MWGSPRAFVTAKPLEFEVMNMNLQAASDGEKERKKERRSLENIWLGVKAKPQPQSDPLIKILCTPKCHDPPPHPQPTQLKKDRLCSNWISPLGADEQIWQWRPTSSIALLPAPHQRQRSPLPAEAGRTASLNVNHVLKLLFNRRWIKPICK